MELKSKSCGGMLLGPEKFSHAAEDVGEGWVRLEMVGWMYCELLELGLGEESEDVLVVELRDGLCIIPGVEVSGVGTELAALAELLAEGPEGEGDGNGLGQPLFCPSAFFSRT